MGTIAAFDDRQAVACLAGGGLLVLSLPSNISGSLALACQLSSNGNDAEALAQPWGHRVLHSPLGLASFLLAGASSLSGCCAPWGVSWRSFDPCKPVHMFHQQPPLELRASQT